MLSLAVVMTLFSGILSGLGHSLQRRSTDVLPELTPRAFYRQNVHLLVVILTTPLWLFGGILAVSGALLRWQAFSLGDVSLLKPLTNINILIVVLVCVGLWGERIGKREWLGLSTLLVGIVLLSLAAEERIIIDYNVFWYFLSTLFSLVLVGFFIFVGSTQNRSNHEKELYFALGAGILYGIATIFLKAMTIEVLQVLGYFNVLDLQSLLILITRGSFWLYVVSSVVAYFLLQSAYSRRRASIALPVNNSVSTLVPIVVAVLVFGDAILDPVNGMLLFPFSFLRIIGIVTVLVGVALIRSFQLKFLESSSERMKAGRNKTFQKIADYISRI